MTLTNQIDVKALLNKIAQAQSEHEYLWILQKLQRLDLDEDIQWYKLYYSCFVCISLSLLKISSDKQSDYLEDAAFFLRRLLLIKPKDPEAIILQALLFQAKGSLSSNHPSSQYTSKIIQLLDIAQALDPQNPRIFYLKAKIASNKVDFLECDKRNILAFLLQAKANYATYIPKHEYAPDWGEPQTNELISWFS